MNYKQRLLVGICFWLVTAANVGAQPLKLDSSSYAFDMGYAFDNAHPGVILEGVAGQMITAGVDASPRHVELGELAVCRNFVRANSLSGRGWARILDVSDTVNKIDSTCDGRPLTLTADGGPLGSLYAWNANSAAWTYGPNTPLMVTPTMNAIDTLHVIDSCGCMDQDSVTIEVRRLSAELRVGSITLDPLSTATYSIPVIFVSGTGLTDRCAPDSLQALITYDSMMFYPTGVTNGRYTKIAPAGNRASLMAVFDPIHGSLTPGDTLGWLDGTALLGDAFSSSVWLGISDDTSWMSSLHVTTTVDTGMLTSTVCNAGGERLIAYRTGSYIKSVTPNPSASNPQIVIVRSGSEPVSLSVYSAVGGLIQRNGWDGIASPALGTIEESVSLPAELASGAYYLILTSGPAKDSRLFIVTH